MKKCPFCEDGYMQHKTITETYTYKGHSLEIQQSGEFCDHCEEGVLNYNDIKTTEKQIRDFQSEIDGLLTSKDVKRIRKKLKLTQKQAANYFGGGANAFSRYERGEATPMRSTSNLLIVLDKYPELLKELVAMPNSEAQ
ncbi:type II toxin-antitoxin system MqsA family antitoxin [Candidatus Albibeggiatoa sp. nov. NOAA]|uniref:type II toxin-antitoxin system MqsA family antitoxin n=1 Tax=Candidatus Albibeggiatoa sp. nov. NOAA TaxID=3162724 RepID=UPI0032F6AF54|nr:type II toxin-antitoxin system MqsA family antitoxin [Thiotrichaceae bacterium]